MRKEIADLNIGDIVRITWRDHYRYVGGRRQKIMKVQSYGKVDEIVPDGIAVVQNEVTTLVDGVERIMDAQFVLKEAITNIEILKPEGGDD